MANTAALISYPCFKDWEKSNINFVESVPHQKKSRKSTGSEKRDSPSFKENPNVNHSFTCIRENSSTNTSRVRKKDVEILPTVVENEEKEENREVFDEIEKISDLPTSSAKKAIPEGSNNFLYSCYDCKYSARRRFSNHSLVTYDTFDELQSSPLSDSSMQQANLKLSEEDWSDNATSDLIPSKNISDNSCETHMTLMPNTNEFREVHLDEWSPLNSNMDSNPSNQTVQQSITNKEYKSETNAKKQRNGKWRTVFGWVISLIAVVIFITVNNDVIQSSRIQKLKPVTSTPTNYEICLLISKNFRRLIVSSLVNFLY